MPRNPPPGQEALIDIRKDKEGAPYIGFIVPIFSIQGDHNAVSQIGRVVGVKTVDANLFSLLKHPGITEKTLECILVRTSGDKLEYLSPLQDGTAALSKHVAGRRSGEIRRSEIGADHRQFRIHDLKDYRD